MIKYINTYIHMYMYIHTYIHTYIIIMPPYIHTYIYTYIRIRIMPIIADDSKLVLRDYLCAKRSQLLNNLRG